MKKKSKKKKKNIKKFKAEKTQNENIIKTKSDWIKKGLVNKKEYQKKYNDSIKNNEGFGKKKAKELLGLNLIKKLKM